MTMTDTVMETTTDTGEDSGWKVLVWDDNIHTFDYVIEVFVKHFGITEVIAARKAWQIHTKGKSVLDRGSKSNMEFHAMIMDTTYGLKSTVEPDSNEA